MRAFFRQIAPFISLGIVIVIFVAGIILFSYLLIIGAILGLAIFAIVWIRDKFFPSKKLTLYKKDERKGQTFDHKHH